MSNVLLNIIKDDLVEIIEKYKEKVHYVPSHSAPVGTNKRKALMFMYNRMLYRGHLGDILGPGGDEFPGEALISQKVVNTWPSFQQSVIILGF